MYDKALNPHEKATVEDLKLLVRQKADEMKKCEDPVELRKLCLKLHDAARRAD